MSKRKIIPITDATARREQRFDHETGIAKKSRFPSSYGELPLFARLRFSPVGPALLVFVGALFTGSGIVDRLPVMWIPGGLLVFAGVAWFLDRGGLYRFVLRSGGSSPRTPSPSDKPATPDDDHPAGPYNDSIVTRG